MSALFIINPISGKGRKGRLKEEIQGRGHRCVFTEYASHAEELAKTASEDIVVAVGGDGTGNEVARGLLGTGKTLGIVPCGSGDGLARSLGISHNPAKAIDIVERGRTQALDAGFVNSRPFFSVCGMGFDADVSKLFAQSGRRGMFNYVRQALKLWRGYDPETFTINIDGREWTQKAVLITAGNSNQWGNNAKVTPYASTCDGLLDLTVLDDFHSIEIPFLASALMTGHCDISRRVHCFTGRHIILKRHHSGTAHFDGDWFETGDILDISILPAALKVLVPSERK